jgi:hypothetical protein
MEEIIERALNVVKSNPEWTTYVKTFNDPAGFLFTESILLETIKEAIDAENQIHSGASIAMCLQKCKIILNNT